ncbi:MAG TPA: class I SAM-dependent methyltransferase [Candidatus Deferrimicrobiaceae bacterium]|nr:class I SAM-dependent methyltransferase [Candidatus Deferrimicrobiaceae bacterium]
MRERATVELIDAGDGRRLERFGERVVDRPAAAATEPRRAWEAWSTTDLRFEAGRGWSGRSPIEPWQVELGGLTFELRPMPSGGVGLFPEQAANVPWLEARVAARARAAEPPRILNLFAHTGLLTLAAARAGASVVHVDASRPAVAWARRNAELSGLDERPIRWLVDDAAAFVAREGRRARHYDGLILDPPSFGRAGARRWRLLEDLPDLLAACASIVTHEAFVLLTAHTTGVTGPELANLAAAALGGPAFGVEPLRLDADTGARLELAVAIRRG